MDSQTIIILAAIAVLGLIALGVIHNRLTVKAKKGDFEISLDCSNPPPPTPAPSQSIPVLQNQTNIGHDQLNAAGDMLHFRDLIVGDTKQPALNLNQIGEPVGDFVGREDEIRNLMAAFEGGGENRGAVISGVRGMGGVGKTELAKMAIKRLKGQFPDGQIFFNLRGVRDDEEVQPATPAEALQHVIQAFRPDVKLPDAVDQLQSFYHSVLEGKRVLLLMDNALDAGQLAPLAPPPDGCALIVTSRYHISLPDMSKVDLDTMPPLEARDLLVRICPRIDGHADGLAERCGYLPLALRLSASALDRNPAITVEQYLDRLEKEQDRLALLDRDHKMVAVDRGVKASLAASYNLLDDRLQRLWRALAVFPGDFDGLAACSVWHLEEKEGAAALGELYTASMVLWDEATRRYRLHDLARHYAHDRLSGRERTEYARRHATHYGDVLGVTSYLYKEGGQSALKALAVYDLESDNIHAGQVWAATHWEEDEVAAQVCSDYSETGCYCLHLRLHPRKWLSWLERALAAAQKLKDREAEGRHVANMGTAYTDIGDWSSAIREYEKALIISRERGNRHSEGIDLANLGVAFAGSGNSRKAVDLYEQALLISREVGDQILEGNILGNLGSAYYSFGEVSKAMGYYKQQLEIVRKIGDRLGEGSILINVASAYSELGNSKRAIELYRQALLFLSEIGDQPAVAIALYNLAHALVSSGDRTGAIAAAEQAVRIWEKIDGSLAARARSRLEQIQNTVL